jgi:putative cardiolipin synthase
MHPSSLSHRSFSRAARVLGLELAMAGLLAVLQGCATLPPPVSRAPTRALPASASTELGRIAVQSVPAGAGSGFRPLPQANFSMDARLTLARHAQQSLDLQYYLLANDVTGHKLLRAVRDAAGRGVRVRILVDDLYTASSDDMLLELSAFPNIEVRLFNPFPAGRSFDLTRWGFALGDFSRLNHRMHNKMFIADGAFAVAGGRNMADEYFFNSKEGNFIDFDLLIAGEAVPQLAGIFDTYWNSPHVLPQLDVLTPATDPATRRAHFEVRTADATLAYPDPPAATPDLLGSFPLSAEIDHPPLNLLYGHIEVFADNPEKVTGRAEAGTDPTTVTARVIRAIAEAHSEVTIGSPYFIPGKLGLEGLESVRQRGVTIIVMTNSLASNDEPFASAAYAGYRKAMLKMGVRLYEVDPGGMSKDPFIGKVLKQSIGRSHSKLVILDHQTTFVGSMNMDLRSSRENTELGMLVDSPKLAEDVLALAKFVRSVGSYRLRLAGPDEHIEWIGGENPGMNGEPKLGAGAGPGSSTGSSTGSATSAATESEVAIYDDDPGVDLSTRLKIWLFFPFISESLL